MAQFAPVAPVHILQKLFTQDVRALFGDYHLLLAHHTVEKETEFRGLWRDYERRTSLNRVGATIIMDNSIVELGGAVDDQMIRDSVDIIKDGVGNRSHVIPVLPDVMNYGEDTTDLSAEAYHRWINEDMPGDGFMLVTQGANFADFAKLVNYFFVLNADIFKHIRWVGIPRVLSKNIGSREKAVRYVQAVAPHLKIHLLGFGDDIVDDMLTARIPCVVGIDSAVPVRFNEVLTPTTFVPSRDPAWMIEGQLSATNCQNIRNVRKWVGFGVHDRKN